MSLAYEVAVLPQSADVVYEWSPPYPSDWTIDWTIGDCVTLTYDAKLSGATMSLTKVNSCQDAVGLCKAKLGKLDNLVSFMKILQCTYMFFIYYCLAKSFSCSHWHRLGARGGLYSRPGGERPQPGDRPHHLRHLQPHDKGQLPHPGTLFN